MPIAQVAGRELGFDSHGFMTEFDAWNEDIAREMAAEEGLELTECHWKVIHFLRDYYYTYETPPSPQVVLKTLADKLIDNVHCTRKNLERVFPKGGCKQACRLAGLPRHYCPAC